MQRLTKITLLLPVLMLFAFSGPKAAIEWEFTEYDFGSIKKGEPATIEFKFKNPGMIPLIVTNVKSSCGCTVPDYPKQPITSNKEGEIAVTYDAKTSGHFSKTVTVFTNTSDGLTELVIKGVVD